VVLAILYEAIDDVVTKIGSWTDCKVVLDITNAFGDNGDLAICFSTSVAEELQKEFPKSFLVKAFNTVFASNQNSG
jgi:predicted dinucleotide-binding enzyme